MSANTEHPPIHTHPLATADFLLHTVTDSRWPPYVIARVRLPDKFLSVLDFASTFRKIGPTLHPSLGRVLVDGVAGSIRFFESNVYELSKVRFDMMIERDFSRIECLFDGSRIVFRGFQDSGNYAETEPLNIKELTALLKPNL
jgi:hypothetical protein